MEKKESWNKIKFYGFKGPLEMAMSGAVSRLGVWAKYPNDSVKSGRNKVERL